MPIDYKLSKVVIKKFRGIDSLEIDLREGFPTVLIGSNNAGKSTVLAAIALALNNASFNQWTAAETDFFTEPNGVRASEFVVQVLFSADREEGYPAVHGIGQVQVIHGVQMKGRITKAGKISSTRTLLDSKRQSITISTRSPLAAGDKQRFAEHDVNYRPVNARLDDIYDVSPEVWLFKPQNIDASLYIWKTGPIQKLSRLLAQRFLLDPWVLQLPGGQTRDMPDALQAAYGFFRRAVEEFPFWQKEMKPKLEAIFGRYVGAPAQIDLKPSTQVIEDWLAQQLAISLATDPESAPTPLRSMGDGWQAVIRLAALEALAEFKDLIKDRVVLLLEEPETHLHPHLRRRVRKVLGELAAKGWVIVMTTHSPEMVSFDEKQVIHRLVRRGGKVTCGTVHTDQVDTEAKLQSKLDERGAHDFLFSTGAVFCEGKNDGFAMRLGFDMTKVDYDGRSVSITQCGDVGAIPAFTAISKQLGIRWCALTDEDLLEDGSVKPMTLKAQKKIEKHRGDADLMLTWPGDLERCFGHTTGKMTPEIVVSKLADPAWQASHPQYKSVLAGVAAWIDPTITI
jgi:predicted ATPase